VITIILQASAAITMEASDYAAPSPNQKKGRRIWGPFLGLGDKASEVYVDTQEEVPTEAVIWVTTGSSEQPKWWLLVQQVVNASCETEVIANVKADADVVIDNSGVINLRKLVSIRWRQFNNVTQYWVAGCTLTSSLATECASKRTLAQIIVLGFI